MQQQLIQEHWTDAVSQILKSCQYKQISHFVNIRDRYCAIGVILKRTVGLSDDDTTNYINAKKFFNTHTHDDDKSMDIIRDIITWNDNDQFTFSEIADLLVSKYGNY